MTSNLQLCNYTFPKGFAWGASTAAYQIEGGWDADGKGPNVWDTFTHQGGDRVFKNQTGDVACGSYTLWEEDLKCIKQLGLTHYRFSLSWSRLLPDGTTGFINQKGIDYYNKVIDDLLTNGIMPMVTLNHFDLPQALEDQGGWLSENIVGFFNKYAEFCFNTFGNRVKMWITINEPSIVAKYAYENGLHAPGIKESGTGAYQTAHNMIKAHAKAWHTYHLLFKEKQHGFVSLALNANWAEPLDPTSEADVKATERYLAFSLGWFAKPIFIDGDYPPLMKSSVAAKSKEQGYPSSRLPEFTKEEMQMIKGTADFFCLNYYTTRKIRHQEYAQARPSFQADEEVEEIKDPSWPISSIEWLAVVPWGIRKLLKHIKDTCNDPIIYITENGFAQSDPAPLEDAQRWEYFRQTLLEILKGIYIDKANVKGYFVWSLMDNFEWTEGYSKRFGLFHVDYNSSSLPRVPYTSASEYAKVVSSNRLPEPEKKLK
ncbi:lactase-like protein [Microcaecilia unicolor]|uniref:Cytosolic beta-glucosidase n=1 Tax=Microcaecilia unicolor TaxID=1415580 RepID=A0A6P7X147_9AMPH|nr:lactase-like protein [Microcaecilia unicolor]